MYTSLPGEPRSTLSAPLARRKIPHGNLKRHHGEIDGERRRQTARRVGDEKRAKRGPVWDASSRASPEVTHLRTNTVEIPKFEMSKGSCPPLRVCRSGDTIR